ncbi:hypothetical protein HU200_042247 [Digitaria exilis]|uniref:Uncharacterized protein n=1 Tax=Digitaria exilis TaxID=1010633 RepID=A0A835EII2_9POAL|nr:hypothetical protein HU200_042247 [Digitaria exilis]
MHTVVLHSPATVARLLDVLPKSDVEVNPTNEGEGACKFPDDDGPRRRPPLCEARETSRQLATSLLRPPFEDASRSMSPAPLSGELLGRALERRKAVVRELAMRDKPGATPRASRTATRLRRRRVHRHVHGAGCSALAVKLSKFAPMSASDIELHAKASARVAASQRRHGPLAHCA